MHSTPTSRLGQRPGLDAAEFKAPRSSFARLRVRAPASMDAPRGRARKTSGWRVGGRARARAPLARASSLPRPQTAVRHRGIGGRSCCTGLLLKWEGSGCAGRRVPRVGSWAYLEEAEIRRWCRRATSLIQWAGVQHRGGTGGPPRSTRERGTRRTQIPCRIVRIALNSISRSNKECWMVARNKCGNGQKRKSRWSLEGTNPAVVAVFARVLELPFLKTREIRILTAVTPRARSVSS